MSDFMPVWPGWTTVCLIGRGSFGAVYEIERDILGEKEKAALKVISIPQSESDIREMYGDGYDEESITSTFRDHLKSIVAEYSLMRKLNGSANVVNCDDVRYVQHDDGIGWDIFIKMELLTPLTAVLPAEIPEKQVLKIAKDLSHALVQCRQFDIVHRDIKPQNIFVSPLGDYKLGDFGIAKTVERTSGGTRIGTYKYMAPEVYNNQPYGAGADIYSLGLVLYWLLNERRMPFLPLPPEKLRAGMEDQARLRRFNGEAIPAPAHGSEALKKIVLKACAYDPKDRYHSAEELLRDLDKLDTPGAAPRPSSSGLDEDGTIGAFGKAAPAPGGPSIPDEDATVGLFGKPSPASVEAAVSRPPVKPEPKKEEIKPEKKPEPTPPVPPAPPKKKTGLIVGILGALAVAAAVLLFVLLPKGEEPVNQASPSPLAESTPVVEECRHDWQAASCTEPKTCARCGMTEGQALGHDWRAASCTEPKTCTRCGLTEGQALGHDWRAASCTEPKTCKRCGLTEGQALGHDWRAANCEQPRTCTRCGLTEGQALGHDWRAASCTEPKTCKRCGKTEGQALGHDWTAATYTTPATCTRCGATTGDIKGYLGTVPTHSGENPVVFAWWTIHPLKFDTPLTNCRRATIHVEMKIKSQYQQYTKYKIYLQLENGTWIEYMNFKLVEGKKDIVLSFDQPTTLLGFCVYPGFTDYIEWETYSYYMDEIQVYEN